MSSLGRLWYKSIETPRRGGWVKTSKKSIFIGTVFIHIYSVNPHFNEDQQSWFQSNFFQSTFADIYLYIYIYLTFMALLCKLFL